jgi:predicted Zn-dependent peptidase
VLARALGGGMSSPLFQEVREKRGLVYSVHAYSDHGADHGDFVIFAGTTAKHVEELFTVACGELTKATTQISEQDIVRAKNAMLVGLATAKERPFSLAQGIAGSLFERGFVMTPEQTMEAVNAVTIDDVQKAASSVIASQPTISLVGPVPDADYHAKVIAALH